MGKHNDTRQIRSVSTRIFWQLAGFGAVLALGACVQIAGITKPTLLDESQGGDGGGGGEVVVGSGPSSSSSSGAGGSSNTTSSSSSSSSSSSGGGACMNSGDCPNLGNECVDVSCVMGACVSANSMSGQSCTGGVCNGMGACVECTADGDCGPGSVCNMNQCASCSDGQKNGSETGIDCGGSSCKKCDGDPCAMSTDCKSSFCTDAVCCNSACTGTCKSCGITGNVGICSNIPLGNSDDSPMCSGTSICNGSGSCKLKNGEACSNDLDCASNNCAGAPKMCVP